MIDRAGRDMSKGSGRWRRAVRGAGLAPLLFWAAEAWAAGGGGKATKLVNVADTRGMECGLNKWIADVYNTDLWLFGLLVVGVMVVMGGVLGLVFDRLISLLGIRLGKLDHHE